MPVRQRFAIALLQLALVSSGCSVFDDAWLAAHYEPKLFRDYSDEQASGAAYRALADRVWAELGNPFPESCLQGDYAWGFREGFASYVYAGGDGQPPAVPPRPYWQLDLRNAQGAAAVQSWFDGYRHGARVAREGGYRRTATIKLSASLRDCDACGCPDEPCNKNCMQALPPAEIEVEAAGPELVPQPAELLIPHDVEEVVEPPFDATPPAEPSELPGPSLEAKRDTPQRATVPTAIFRISR